MTYPSILQSADRGQLEQAVAYNHMELFRQESIALGGHMHSHDGISWTTGTAHSASMIAFPELSSDGAGAHLDELLSFYLHHPPSGAGCWSLDPPRPHDLAVNLLARGFQPGFRPHWMALELGQVQVHHISPKGLTIVANNELSLTAVRDLPYARVVVPLPAYAERPGQWVRFVATLRGAIVGQSVVFLTSGPWGVAGIYHVGVVPRARNKGIGKAVTLAACQYAREKGYRFAVLNSTDSGRHTYRQLGFSAIGDGWTWWLAMDRFLSRPPSAAEIRLAEAIGHGDDSDLASLRKDHPSEMLDSELTNGMTLMQLAVHCRQHRSAEWLMAGGADASVLDAWDLGWKDLARQLLREKPGQIGRLYGKEEKTLLHIAAERDDGELAQLAISAKPDLQLKDKTWKATALDWAKHLGHPEIALLIKAHGKG
jgi:GNAT superfamily N-acetyltransferase